MAEDALFSIAGELIKTLGSLAAQEVALYCGVKDQLRKLRGTVTTIKAVLLDAEKQAQKENAQLRDWLGKLREVALDAEDLLDDFSTELLQKQLMPGGSVSKEVRIFFSRSNQFLYGWRMGHKVKDLKERLNEIDADKEKFNFEVRQEERPPLTTMVRGQTTSSEPDIVVGREHDRGEVIGFLLHSNNDKKNVSVMSIVGMGGLGKTTLAQHVFNDEQVKSHFSVRFWVSVSGGLDVKKIVKDILEAVGIREDFSQLENLKSRLEQEIKDKRYLLVLDDVWDGMDSQDGEKWDSLRQLLSTGIEGNRIIITTRSERIAKLTSTKGKYHVLKGLSDDDSWNLFKERAFPQDQDSSPTVNKEVKEEIVKRCCGVPLVIKAIARLMYQKDRDQWLSFIYQELPDSVQDDNIINTLRLSYDPLPSHMKHCFAYCRLFSKGQKIDVKSLIQLWIAQGFINPSDPNVSLEVAGLRCFEDLLWRSFFHEAEKDDFGNISFCKMHDFMHDLAAKVAGCKSTKVDQEGTTISESTRHVSLNMALDLSPHIPIPLLSAKNLRTLILRRGDQHKWNKGTWKLICRGFKRLRVLDLQCSRSLMVHELGMQEVSPLIKKMKHLRYLDLSYNDMETLPNSITNLVNLQVLKLNGCRKLKALPRDINKLINLRDIDVGSRIDFDLCENLENMPCGVGQLTSLQTLSYFVVGAKDSSKSKYIGGLDELKRLNELRSRLEIRIVGYERNTCISEFKEAKLSEKQYLQTLAIDWPVSDGASGLDVDVDLYDELLQILQPHSNLQRFDLSGYGGIRFPSWLSYLTNLKTFSLQNCERCKHIPPLDGIPFLEELSLSVLSDLEYIDSEGVGGREVNTFFPSLKTLWISSCPKLKGWWKTGRSDDNDGMSSSRTPTAIEEGEDCLMLYYFPCLSSLEILKCSNLTSMPLFPSLDDTLVLWDTGSVPLQQTMKMTASSAWKSPVPPVSSPSSFNQPSLSKLKKLDMLHVEDMESLPGMQNLSSLQELMIEDCPRLKSLPLSQKTHPCLEELRIGNCRELRLSESIHREGKKAVEWPSIAYIPNIIINSVPIQCDDKHAWYYYKYYCQ